LGYFQWFASLADASGFREAIYTFAKHGQNRQNAKRRNERKSLENMVFSSDGLKPSADQEAKNGQNGRQHGNVSPQMAANGGEMALTRRLTPLGSPVSTPALLFVLAELR